MAICICSDHRHSNSTKLQPKRKSWTTRADHPVQIGDAVLIGPHTHLNGIRAEDEGFIATSLCLAILPVKTRPRREETALSSRRKAPRGT